MNASKLQRDIENMQHALNLTPEQREIKQRSEEICKLLKEYDVCLKAIVIHKKYGENAYKLATDEEKQILIDSARLYIKTRDKLYLEDPRLHRYKEAVEKAVKRNMEVIERNVKANHYQERNKED